MTEPNQKTPDNLHFDCIDNLPSKQLLSSLLDLHLRVFEGQTRDSLLAEIAYQQDRRLITWLALDQHQVVGYKMGYERKPGHFYSWLGCVDPEYRGCGIASALMNRQHEWCRQQGYRAVRTQIYNQWRTMLLLNIRHGFDIVGTQQGTHGLLIVLEKKL